MQPTLVVGPDARFSEIDQLLKSLGWSRGADTMIVRPLVPGEPEMAIWQRVSGARIGYTFNPAVRLRVLCFYGENASAFSNEVAQQLPCLDEADILELLQSEDVERILLGILASGEIGQAQTLEAINQLRKHPHGVVAHAATTVGERLGKEAGS